VAKDQTEGVVDRLTVSRDEQRWSVPTIPSIGTDPRRHD
jgi:hypothetical protein